MCIKLEMHACLPHDMNQNNNKSGPLHCVIKPDGSYTLSSCPPLSPPRQISPSLKEQSAEPLYLRLKLKVSFTQARLPEELKRYYHLLQDPFLSAQSKQSEVGDITHSPLPPSSLFAVGSAPGLLLVQLSPASPGSSSSSAEALHTLGEGDAYSTLSSLLASSGAQGSSKTATATALLSSVERKTVQAQLLQDPRAVPLGAQAAMCRPRSTQEQRSGGRKGQTKAKAGSHDNCPSKYPRHMSTSGDGTEGSISKNAFIASEIFPFETHLDVLSLVPPSPPHPVVPSSSSLSPSPSLLPASVSSSDLALGPGSPKSLSLAQVRVRPSPSPPPALFFLSPWTKSTLPDRQWYKYI